MNKQIYITGGAGFIGSSLVAFLNKFGIKPIIIDNLEELGEKWKNIAGLQYSDLLDYRDEICCDAEAIMIHLGANVSTTEPFNKKLWENNVKYTVKLIGTFAWDRFIYASSAATYGSSSDFRERFNCKPNNAYGFTKLTVDKFLIENNEFAESNSVYGLRFFNVYGFEREFHKGNMMSFPARCLNKDKINIYRYYPEPVRDFVYVEDVCKVIKFFIDSEASGGIYNVGSGRAISFEEVAKTVAPKATIEYIDMPEEIKKGYQQYTEANLDKLRAVGYKEEFKTIQEAYREYLDK